MTPPAFAGSIDNRAVGSERQVQAPTRVLTTEELQNRLVSLGVDPEEAKVRLADLTLEDRTELTRHLDSMTAGGDSSITISVGAAVIIVLLLIIFL